MVGVGINDIRNQRLARERTEKEDYRDAVYEFLFYTDKKWEHQGPTQFFNGVSIHYSDFMKAKRGSL